MDIMKMLGARMWMKRNEPFLYSWHAYVGYEMDLFSAFERPMKPSDVADAYNIDEELLQQWVTVGLAIGHLKRASRERVKTGAKWKLPRAKGEASSGVILKEMMELHIPSLLQYPDLMRNKSRQSFEEEKHAPTVAQTSRLLETVAMPKITKLLKDGQVKTVLDVGCGEAGYIRKLARKFPDVSFTGIEMSECVATTATDKSKEYVNVTVLNEDLWEYDPEEKFDLVIMNNVIHYIHPEKRQDLFRRLADWTTENGKISIITPIAGEESDTPFVAAFNGFFHTFENLHPLPREEELVNWGDGSKLRFDGKSTIIREGSWYAVKYQKSS
ncbi:class I SAM-dependent methyltransferase [Paenisporosarcina cavernae]|uniref:Class I SAM-dependent methyltransferase n=1 Tax=Paenisporosarcina cavernae TaxID=2320858 RepID=A0A385YU92_9BACL|nr:class I SAM-dependent methyltransferase [Paenisporosarcina cavernae]AYC30246.1 class I SAM-dependent methyltransferase [Paenisporosarcina cavernae]